MSEKPKMGKKILTVYERDYHKVVVLGEKGYITRICHEELLECIAEALRDLPLERMLEEDEQ